MRQSQALIPTMKEDPADADVVSHRLMLRAGIIRQLAAGLYTWLPLGLAVIRKIEAIIREELNVSGAQEILMPVVQPSELWQETGRWLKMGDAMMRMKDRHNRDFCLGPTHEEVITDLFRREIHSYKQLPCNFYQIQTKFRDERRPRFGVMRAREFTMKDGYSFDLDQKSFADTYQRMYDCYTRIFTRMNLDFRAVEADSGDIGGANSHEFHVLAASGEDTIAYADAGPYAANLERAVSAPPAARAAPAQSLTKVHTPNVRSIQDVANLLNLAPRQCIKTLLVRGDAKSNDNPDSSDRSGNSGVIVALILRGDHELNDIKAQNIPGITSPLTFATEAEALAATGAPFGSLGPLGLLLKVIVDPEAAALADFCCGANEADYHYTGVNWEVDLPLDADRVVDIRNVVEGDQAPLLDGKSQGVLKFLKGIEVGHIFALGDVYSAPMQVSVLDAQGKPAVPVMGCYGMGVTRLVAAVIEQNHDTNGIVWPEPLAPFQLHIVALNYGKSDAVREAADALYQSSRDAGVVALLDDRDERPGVKFADADLIGIPHRVVIGDRSLKEGKVEYRRRADTDAEGVPLDEVLARVQGR